MNLEDKLFLTRFQPDNQSHLMIKDRDTCAHKCSEKYCTFVCPAKVYDWEEEEQKIHIGYEGCVECGTCRYGCIFDNIEWKYPRGGFGVQYKYG